MSQPDLGGLLDGKGEDDRARIAVRVGQRLSIDDLPDVERRATEALARMLVQDAIERVRRELCMAVRHSKLLPRDIALKIAHDVDSVACPFLEVTGVFSDSDWQQLVLTLSRGALAAVARRSPVSESLARSLAELGDSVVAETLVDNPAAPMTAVVCDTLLGRFDSQIWILDRLAERDDLLAEIVVRLTEKVSAAAREKLQRRYGMAEPIAAVSAEGQIRALLAVVRATPVPGLPALVQALKTEDKLTHKFLLTAAREGLTDFVVAAMAARASQRPEQVKSVLLHAGIGAVTRLFRQAGIPAAMFDDLWAAVLVARGKQ